MVNRRVKLGRSKFCPWQKVFRVKGEWRRASIGILLLGMSACSPFEPIVMGPEMSDLQLTVDTLKISLRDAQRAVAELRAEVDARRQELADVQIARAQLEGHIREAERRLTEARHVIDLQREELASARSERDQMGRTRAALQNQLKRLQKQSSKAGKQVQGDLSPAAMASTTGEHPKPASVIHERNAPLVALEDGAGVSLKPISQPLTVTSRSHVSVRPGDTLWSIARRHRISVEHLMTINALPSDRIQVGQALWLTDPTADQPEHERM